MYLRYVVTVYGNRFCIDKEQYGKGKIMLNISAHKEIIWTVKPV